MSGVAIYVLVVAVLILTSVVLLLLAEPDRYIQEPDDVDPELLPRRMDEWQTAVDRIKQDRGNR